MCELIIYILLFLNSEDLINQLGDPLYENRRQAYQVLEQDILGNYSLLKKNLSNPDPEIRNSCKRLISSFKFAYAEYPEIWRLSNHRRFVEEGYFSVDIATKYYLETYDLYHSKYSFIFYDNTLIAKMATEHYIIDLLFSGAKRNEVYLILQEMEKNDGHYVEYETVLYGMVNFGKFHYPRQIPRSPLLTEPIKEMGLPCLH